MVMRKIVFLGMLLSTSLTNAQPASLQQFIERIVPQNLSGISPKVSYRTEAPNIYHVSVIWNLPKQVNQNQLAIHIYPSFLPGFHWAPMLTPDSSSIIPQHIFKAPALIVSDSSKTISIVPDLSLLANNKGVPWYMDMDARQNALIVGMAKSKVKEHVLYTKDTSAVFPEGKTEIGFYCIVSDKKEDIENPFASTRKFMWEKWGAPLFAAGEPLHQKNLEPYVEQTYNWAFNNWRNVVWQEFELNGTPVGAPVFIVNYTQSPNYPGEVNEREFRSIWNQAWFNSLRSAQGLYRYASYVKNDTLKQYALKTKELALAFPQRNGFFNSVVATEMEQVIIDDTPYNRSKGWQKYYFGNSNRNPYTWDASKSPYHIADMSFTAYWMLIWYQELEKDPRLLTYAKTYADALVKLQDQKGFFPAWLALEDLKPLPFLEQSPETSISVTLLLKLYTITKEEKYLKSATKAIQAVTEAIVPTGQWEDFETYWSCSRVGSQEWVGKKIERNNMYKQNSFSIYWTSEALLDMFEQTEDSTYLKLGLRTLDELLMYQAVWQPPFIAVRSLGGFGVMNADAEWNDSRQSLFAGLIIRYGKLLNNSEYIQRGLAALYASFTMMYTPLNPATQKQWESRWRFFGKEDYGFMMENYGHDGVTSEEGLGIGEFTIYDWGNGAAAEAYNRLRDYYGESFLENRGVRKK